MDWNWRASEAWSGWKTISVACIHDETAILVISHQKQEIIRKNIILLKNASISHHTNRRESFIHGQDTYDLLSMALVYYYYRKSPEVMLFLTNNIS